MAPKKKKTAKKTGKGIQLFEGLETEKDRRKRQILELGHLRLDQARREVDFTIYKPGRRVNFDDIKNKKLWRYTVYDSTKADAKLGLEILVVEEGVDPPKMILHFTTVQQVLFDTSNAKRILLVIPPAEYIERTKILPKIKGVLTLVNGGAYPEDESYHLENDTTVLLRRWVDGEQDKNRLATVLTGSSEKFDRHAEGITPSNTQCDESHARIVGDFLIATKNESKISLKYESVKARKLPDPNPDSYLPPSCTEKYTYDLYVFLSAAHSRKEKDYATRIARSSSIIEIPSSWDILDEMLECAHEYGVFSDLRRRGQGFRIFYDISRLLIQARDEAPEPEIAEEEEEEATQSESEEAEPPLPSSPKKGSSSTSQPGPGHVGKDPPVCGIKELTSANKPLNGFFSPSEYAEVSWTHPNRGLGAAHLDRFRVLSTAYHAEGNGYAESYGGDVAAHLGNSTHVWASKVSVCIYSDVPDLIDSMFSMLSVGIKIY